MRPVPDPARVEQLRRVERSRPAPDWFDSAAGPPPESAGRAGLRTAVSRVAADDPPTDDGLPAGAGPGTVPLDDAHPDGHQPPGVPDVFLSDRRPPDHLPPDGRPPDVRSLTVGRTGRNGRRWLRRFGRHCWRWCTRRRTHRRCPRSSTGRRRRCPAPSRSPIPGATSRAAQRPRAAATTSTPWPGRWARPAWRPFAPGRAGAIGPSRPAGRRAHCLTARPCGFRPADGPTSTQPSTPPHPPSRPAPGSRHHAHRPPATPTPTIRGCESPTPPRRRSRLSRRAQHQQHPDRRLQQPHQPRRRTARPAAAADPAAARSRSVRARTGSSATAVGHLSTRPSRCRSDSAGLV